MLQVVGGIMTKMHMEPCLASLRRNAQAYFFGNEKQVLWEVAVVHIKADRGLSLSSNIWPSTSGIWW